MGIPASGGFYISEAKIVYVKQTILQPHGIKLDSWPGSVALDCLNQLYQLDQPLISQIVVFSKVSLKQNCLKIKEVIC